MLVLLIICLVIITIFYFNRKTKTKVICNNNKLINYLEEIQIPNKKYLLFNLKGNKLNFDFHNLNNKLYFGKKDNLFKFEYLDNYYIISTDTQPRLFLNTTIDGELKLVINSKLKGNRWKIKQLKNEGLLKKFIREDKDIITNRTISKLKHNLGELPNDIDENKLKEILNINIQNSINDNKVYTKLIQNDLKSLYEKYYFIYKNGFFIQSFDYSYYISNDKTMLCPLLEDIIILSDK